MSEEFLTRCLDDKEKAEEMAEFSIPEDWYEEKALMRLRRDQCRNNPRYQIWCLRSVILCSSAEMVGHIGFHSEPNPEYLKNYSINGVEFGYTIFPKFRGNGYAMEAALGMMLWAKQIHHIEEFVITVSPSNLSSLAISKKMGFVKIGEHEDEADGLEEIHLLKSAALKNPLSL
ncbi:MAG: GNAT family N-acetyltransferase [SAR324 cluster bacterium]|nr:GNAT family N-acetyltransferase [SAR324 cluster bacterium]